jgi:hypothetical protein
MKNLYRSLLIVLMTGIISINAFSTNSCSYLASFNKDVPKDSIAWKKYWGLHGVVGLNVAQVGLWNWAEGGNSNAYGRVFANITLIFKKNKHSWETNLDTEYGLSYTPEFDHWKWRKPYDKINFSTKYGWEFHKTWYLTILGGYKSQYANGYEYPDSSRHVISQWASPSYTDISVGIDWKPNSIFSIYFSPVAGRVTTCMDSLLRSRYLGTVLDKPFVATLGMALKAGVNWSPKKAPEFKLISTISLYTPYTDPDQKFGNIDVNWDLSISYQFLKVMNVSLGTSLKYLNKTLIEDKKGHKAPRVQFKEVVGLGIGYTF